MSSPHTYLRRDLTTLVVLIIIVAGALAALWYFEQHDGWFSKLASALLDSLSH